MSSGAPLRAPQDSQESCPWARAGGWILSPEQGEDEGLLCRSRDPWSSSDASKHRPHVALGTGQEQGSSSCSQSRSRARDAPNKGRETQEITPEWKGVSFSGAWPLSLAVFSSGPIPPPAVLLLLL